MKEIQAFCRLFLWTGEKNPSKKALVSWAQLCLPRVAGGLNIKDIGLWNKAAVTKLLWAITFKKDRLWCKWVDTYYIKGRSLHDLTCPTNCSWALKKIIGSFALVTNAGG